MNDSNDPKNSDERLADLESLIAHQAVTIQDLSDAAAKQWTIIDDMTEQVKLLKDRIAVLEDEVKLTSPADEAPPPHY